MDIAAFETDLELGYYAAFEILTYCEKHGIKIGLDGDQLVYDRDAAAPQLRKHIKHYAEHIKLFIMSEGKPPPGIHLLATDAATKRARDYAKTRV